MGPKVPLLGDFGPDLQSFFYITEGLASASYSNL
jgi:hypothetical protein